MFFGVQSYRISGGGPGCLGMYQPGKKPALFFRSRQSSRLIHQILHHPAPIDMAINSMMCLQHQLRLDRWIEKLSINHMYRIPKMFLGYLKKNTQLKNNPPPSQYLSRLASPFPPKNAFGNRHYLPTSSHQSNLVLQFFPKENFTPPKGHPKKSP